MPFKGSYVWKVRQKWGHDLLLLAASGIIIENEAGEILLMRRKDNGLWATIGGYCEEGCSFAETAIRELEEEAGLAAKEEDLIPIASVSNPKTNVFSYPNGDKVQVFGHIFLIKKWQKLDQALDEDEVLEIKFFNLDNIPNEMSAASKNEIAAYKAYLETSEFQVF